MFRRSNFSRRILKMVELMRLPLLEISMTSRSYNSSVKSSYLAMVRPVFFG